MALLSVYNTACVALPETIRWTNPNPAPRDDPQDPVTILVRDPSLAEPTEDCDHRRTLHYYCTVHDMMYTKGGCGQGAHEIRLVCSEHGPERYPMDQLMVWNPSGFDPTLEAQQLDELDRW